MMSFNGEQIARLPRHQSHRACSCRAAALELDGERDDFKTMGAGKGAQIHFVNETEHSLPAGVVNGKETCFFSGAQRFDHWRGRTIQRFTVAADHAHTLI